MVFQIESVVFRLLVFHGGFNWCFDGSIVMVVNLLLLHQVVLFSFLLDPSSTKAQRIRLTLAVPLHVLYLHVFGQSKSDFTQNISSFTPLPKQGKTYYVLTNPFDYLPYGRLAFCVGVLEVK